MEANRDAQSISTSSLLYCYVVQRPRHIRRRYDSSDDVLTLQSRVIKPNNADVGYRNKLVVGCPRSIEVQRRAERRQDYSKRMSPFAEKRTNG